MHVTFKQYIVMNMVTCIVWLLMFNVCLLRTSVHQARGIDVQQVSLVINYDLPTNRENYIHRCVLATTFITNMYILM